MGTMIPARTFRQAWRRYEEYCRSKRIDPFSNIALAVWANEISSDIEDDAIVPPEVEMIDEILGVAKMTG